MREANIEAYFVRQVKGKLRGEAYKFKSPNRANVPDRLALLPGRHTHLVELKAPGELPTPAQLREHARLEELGFSVAVLDSYEAVDQWIELRRTKL